MSALKLRRQEAGWYTFGGGRITYHIVGRNGTLADAMYRSAWVVEISSGLLSPRDRLASFDTKREAVTWLTDLISTEAEHLAEQL
jgi:hypothetical protein